MQGIRTPQTDWLKPGAEKKGIVNGFYDFPYVEPIYPDRWFPSYQIRSLCLPQPFAKRRRMDAYRAYEKP